MSLSNERTKIIDKAIAKIKSLFPYNYGIMVTGSVLTEHFNRKSDVDVIVLCNSFRRVFIESYETDGLKVQAIVLPIYDLDIVFNKDFSSGNGAYIRQVFYGKIIEDRFHLLHRLKRRCTEMFINTQRSTSKFQIDQLRARITTRIEDLEGNGNWDDIIFIILDLYNKISELFFSTNGGWQYTGKLASHVLSDINHNFKECFINSLVSSISKKDKIHALKFSYDFINKLGGPLHFHSTRLNNENVSENTLIIFIPDNGNKYLRELQHNLFYRMKNFLFNSKKYNKIYNYICNDHHTYKSGQYIFCFGSNEMLNQEILPKLEIFHTQIFSSDLHPLATRMLYPYSINPLEIFGNEKMQMTICALLHTIRKFINEDSENYSIHILTFLRSIDLFKDDNAWHSFWVLAYSVYNKINNPEMLPRRLYDTYEKYRTQKHLEMFESKISNNHVHPLKLTNHTRLGNEIAIYFQYINKNLDKLSEYIFDIKCLFNEIHKIFTGKENIILFSLNLVDAILNTLEVSDKTFDIYCMKRLS